MILSNLAIHEALDKGWLILDPEPAPRQFTSAGKCPYQTSAVDLRLGSEIAFFNEGLALNLDLRKGDFSSVFGPNSQNRIITEEQPFVLKPQKLVLGKTLERVGLPIQPEGVITLAARVEGKSSFARCGLLVHFTAPTIHAGFEGTITLELINLGPLDIALYPEMAICQLIVEQVAETPFPNEGQFHGQLKPGGN
jgi:dCTP deaminase